MIAQQCDLEPGEFIWSGGDCHIYNNHLDQVTEQLQRSPFKPPKLCFKRKPKDIFSYEYSDFVLSEYQHHEKISGAVAV